MKISRIRPGLRSRLSKNLTLVLLGNLFSAGLGFFTLILLSRTLSVDDFGMFMVVVSFMVMVQPVASAGLNTTVIKFMSSRLGEGNSSQAHQIFKTSLLGIIFFSSATAGTLLLTAGWLSRLLLRNPAGSRLLRMAAAGVVSLALFYFMKAVFSAIRKFAGLVSLQIAADLLKLTLIGLLVLVSAVTPALALGVYIVVPFLAALSGLLVLRPALGEKVKNIFGRLSSLLSYGVWVFAGAVFEGAFLQSGLLLLAGMKNGRETAVFGLALNLSLIFPVLIISFRSVLLPETSRFTRKGQYESYIKNTLKIFAGALLAVFPLIFISAWIIPLLFGENYRNSVPVFNWLMVSFVFYAVIKILCQALFALNRPKVVALLELGKLILMAVGSVLLIPSLGATAPAVVALVSNALMLLFAVGFLWTVLRRSDLLPQAMGRDM